MGWFDKKAEREPTLEEAIKKGVVGLQTLYSGEITWTEPWTKTIRGTSQNPDSLFFGERQESQEIHHTYKLKPQDLSRIKELILQQDRASKRAKLEQQRYGEKKATEESTRRENIEKWARDNNIG